MLGRSRFESGHGAPSYKRPISPDQWRGPSAIRRPDNSATPPSRQAAT